MYTSSRLQRNLNIDLIKIIAMIGVVCLHTTYPFMAEDKFRIASILYKTSVVAIPLFFMVSGYLLLGRENVSFKYSFKKIWKIVRYVFIASVVYWICIGIINRDFVNIPLLAYTFYGAFVQKGFFFIFWYFGTMCIIYLFYPVLNRMFLNRCGGGIYVLFIFLILLQSVFFIQNIISTGEIGICQTFRLWNWFSYFILGGLLKLIHQKNTRLFGFVTAILIILNSVYQRWLLPSIHDNHCEFFYSSIFVEILVCFIFLFITSLNIKHSTIIKWLNMLFLPVYTFHIVIIGLIPQDCFIGLGSIGALIYFLLILTVSIVVSSVVVRIPGVNKIFQL